MSQQTLMLIEATGIQNYVFGSNQLAQHIGASELVRQATTDWVYKKLPGPHNVDRAGDEPEIGDRSIRADGLAAEVVYAGGGNAMILFANDAEAGRFARSLTRQALETAPGLRLVLKRQPFDPDREALKDLHQELRGKLAQRKLDRDFSTPLLGLGVTAACVYTGEPAVEVQDDQLISASVRAKLAHQEAGNERLKSQLPRVGKRNYDFIYDFDDFGEKGESSYLAVIHTDGNDMGKRIQRLGEDFDTPGDNERYVKTLRAFSRSVQKAAKTALDATVDMLLKPENLVVEKGKEKIGGVVPVPVRRGLKRLPFRPIVFGGDDVTFVCEGRLGLTVAAKYLAEFSEKTLSDGQPAHARAGVAVVKSHYPFSRAYGLAEDLCRSAKEYIQEAAEPDGLTALDWHFAVSGLVLPLAKLREREYHALEGSLLMRPLRLSKPAGDWRSWATLTRLMDEFQREDRNWAGRRNKIKALREALRNGREAVRHFLYQETLPDIPQRPNMKTQGWQGPYCGYFDAIEALDFYVALEGGISP